MTAKGSPAYYADRRQGAPYDHAAELLKRRTTARANGMFDEFSERPAFEAWFADSRCLVQPFKLERLPDGTYADNSVQRHWWTWQMSVGGGKSLPPFDPIKIAAGRIRDKAGA